MAVNDEARAQMTEQQLARRGIRDERVLGAFREVPRERFVPSYLRHRAFDDSPLPIGEDQTISQPYVVALMLEALELHPGDRVLEVGAGSGYATALCSRLAREVVGIERIEPLARRAAATLAELGYTNAGIVVADGSVGAADRGPFDAILVSAAAPAMPTSLVEQLAPGGRLVAPVGSSGLQRLVRVRRDAHGATTSDDLGPVGFVPLIGREGWPA
jgi:protein-L-isoaspartate(D-aspartate) O-methyltransferase